jgi:hypothetical protein
MLNSSGLFWIDLHDLHLLLDNSGWAILLEGTGVGENRTKIIIEELFQKQPFTNLLNEKGVKQLIFFLESGNNEKDQISFTDLEEISDAFYQRFGKELDIIAWSITADSSLGKKMRLSVLMNGEFEINPYQRSS